MISISILFLLVANLFGCKQDDCPPEPITARSPVVWKKGLEKSGLTSTPHYYNGTIIFGHKAKEVNNYLVYCLDAETGYSIWQTRIITPFEFDPFTGQMSVVYENKLILSTSKRMFVLNADNGDILWNYTDPYNYAGTCIIDDYIYLADFVLRETSAMYRFNINTGVKEALFSIKHGIDEPGGDFTPKLLMPVQWIHPSGDKIPVLQTAAMDMIRWVQMECMAIARWI